MLVRLILGSAWAGAPPSKNISNTNLLMDKAARSDAKIKRLADGVGCTKQSLDWLESALDPFPDENRDISGFPDMVNGKSVVQCFRSKTTVSAPGAVNWDAHIFHDGMFQSVPVVTTTVNYNSYAQTGQGVTSYNVGGISVRTAAANAPLYLDTTKNAMQLDPGFDESIPYRVIAQGFEISNTTAELNKQGNVIVWRQPQAELPMGIANVGPLVTTANQSVSLLSYQNPPETASQALILQGSQSWKAADGVYAVGTIGNPTLSLHKNTTAEANSSLVVNSNSVIYFPPIIGANPYTVQQRVVQSGFNQYGAYFTGLSPETTLDVVWHFIVERFPRSVDTDLVTMSSNSSPYDPKALELYSKTSWHLPVGCKVDENGLGDWIADVASILQDFGVPGMGFVKNVAKGGQAIANSFEKQSTNNVEPERPPPRLQQQQQVRLAPQQTQKKMKQPAREPEKKKKKKNKK